MSAPGYVLLPRVARAGFVAVGVLPWALPLLRAWLPLGVVGVGLDAAFVTMCHRMPERTLALAGMAMPLCSRCAGVFAGVAAGALIGGWGGGSWSAAAWRRAIVAASALMILDVATQDLGVHPVWHPTRIATGFLFGFALAAACMRALLGEANPSPPSRPA